MEQDLRTEDITESPDLEKTAEIPDPEKTGEGQPGGSRPDFADAVRGVFNLREQDFTQYSPLALAFLGDAVYDLVIRTALVQKANRQAAKLHSIKSSLVKAGTQRAIIRTLEPGLTEEERAVYHRGRNAKPYNTAKNASRSEYLEATGFEALMGYLYLMHRQDRMMELVQKGLADIGVKIH